MTGVDSGALLPIVTSPVEVDCRVKEVSDDSPKLLLTETVPAAPALTGAPLRVNVAELAGDTKLKLRFPLPGLDIRNSFPEATAVIRALPDNCRVSVRIETDEPFWID